MTTVYARPTDGDALVPGLGSLRATLVDAGGRRVSPFTLTGDLVVETFAQAALVGEGEAARWEMALWPNADGQGDATFWQIEAKGRRSSHTWAVVVPDQESIALSDLLSLDVPDWEAEWPTQRGYIDGQLASALADLDVLTEPEADLLYRRIGQLVALADVEGLAAALLAKADLVGGKLVTSQLPPIATAEVVAVADEAAMLALTPAEVQPGDRALRQDLDQSPIYVLTGADPSALASWRRQVEVPGIYSVNGQSGSEVTLGAADVGASPSGHLHDERYRRLSESVPQASVSGLAAALAARPTGTGVSAIVALTQAAYDALTPDPTTLYVVTD